MAEMHPILWSRLTDTRLTKPGCEVHVLSTYEHRCYELTDNGMIFEPQTDLAILNYIIQNKAYNQEFIDKHVNFTKTPTDIGYGLRDEHPLQKAAKNPNKGELSKISFEEYAKSVGPYTLEYTSKLSNPRANGKSDDADQTDISGKPMGNTLIHAVAMHRAHKDGKMNCFWVQCNNNMQAAANMNDESYPGWRNPDNFIAVTDPYPTVSAQAADLILPTSMWIEKEGAYGNAERRTQFWRQQVQGPGEWLILRRISQLGILALFLLGPLFGVWIVKGNLAASMTLDVLPLTDPHVLLQSVLSGVTPVKSAIVGVVIVLLFYFLVGGRVYCSWVCPVNMITDLAAWLRRRLGIRTSSQLSRSARFWMLGLTLVLPLVVSGGIVWELVNPVSMMFRGIVFGMGAAWLILLGVFLFDLLIAKDGWCGHLCPVGAFYNLVGSKSLLKVNAANRTVCNDCMECYLVCPEPQVIKPALKGAIKGLGPVISSSDCTNCGRCIDIYAKDVFSYGGRHTIEVGESNKSIDQGIKT